jgi:hypothetical protein
MRRSWLAAATLALTLPGAGAIDSPAAAPAVDE